MSQNLSFAAVVIGALRVNYINALNNLIPAPTAAPLNIRTEAPNSTEIMVTWDPPPQDTQNGELSGYKVCLMFESSFLHRCLFV